MHTQGPTYDTRRGASIHRGVEGYAEADAIEDRRERERALAAVRAAGNRETRVESGAPSAHQINSMLADAVGLALADPTHAAAMKAIFGPVMKRSLAARGFTLKHQDTLRLVDTRLRPSTRLLEYEARERMEKEIADAMERRRKGTVAWAEYEERDEAD